jgi:hypothetical protein
MIQYLSMGWNAVLTPKEYSFISKIGSSNEHVFLFEEAPSWSKFNVNSNNENSCQQA